MLSLFLLEPWLPPGLLVPLLVPLLEPLLVVLLLAPVLAPVPLLPLPALVPWLVLLDRSAGACT